MTAQSIKTQPMDFSRSATNQKIKALPNHDGFDVIMENNWKTNMTDKDKPITKQKSVMTKVKEVTEKVIKNQSKVNQDMNSSPVSKEELVTGDKGSLKKDILADETLIPEEQLLVILGTIQQAIMDVLNIDMEELNKQMDDLGIETTDLLNPESLRQLVLNSNGESEITAFLTDEHLAKSMNELLENVDAILTDAGIELSEDGLKAFVEKVHNLMSDNEEDLDEIPHNSQQLEEDFSSISTTNEESQALDTSIVQDVMSDNPSAFDNIAEKTVRQEIKTEHTSKAEMDNKVADAIESKAPNGVETRELEFSQADQDDNNSNEMNPNNQLDGFINQMINATQKTGRGDFDINDVEITEFREIANQIIKGIKVTAVKDQASMELQLNPENLGKVNLSVQSKDGILTAQFIVNNDKVKEAIESQMVVLKDSLEQQGLKVETIEVAVANYSFDQRHESNSSEAFKEQEQTRRKITLDEAIDFTEIPQDEETIDNLNNDLGNQIDYTA